MAPNHGANEIGDDFKMKIGNLYNLNSIKAFNDKSAKLDFVDSVYGGIVLERNLVTVDPTILEMQYPELTFVNSGIAVNNVGGYTRKIQTLRKQYLGAFAKAGDRSSNAGKMSIRLEDSYIDVEERKGFAEWSQSDLKEAQLQGISLAGELVETFSEQYQREIDEVGLLGRTATSGLLNHASFTSAAASAVLNADTPAAAYNIIANELIIAQHTAVKKIAAFKGTVVVMPQGAMSYLQKTLMNSTYGADVSILRALQIQFPEVSFQESFRATTMIGIYSVDPRAMVMRIPVPLSVGEIIKKGSFTYSMEAMYRVAGLDVLEGKAGYILTGAWS